MITVSNYTDKINKIDLSQLPKTIQETKTDIDDIIEFYNDDKDIKEAVDLFLKQLNVAYATPKKNTNAKPAKKQPENKVIRQDEKDGTKLQIIERINATTKKPYYQYVVDGKVKGRGTLSEMEDRYNGHVMFAADNSKKQKELRSKIDSKVVDHFSKEFVLIRRFFNLMKKEIIPFRSLQLLHMAIQKSIVARDVRKSSEAADLFAKVAKKVKAAFDIVEPKKEVANKHGVNIKIADTSFLNEVEKFVKDQKVNYAITLLKSFISMQGTKPELQKAENLVSRINKAIDNGKIDKENRLYSEIKDAAKELEDYIADPNEKIEPETYRLSAPRICDNRVKCDGLKQNGKLKRGYKFSKGGQVVKAGSSKKKSKLASPVEIPTIIIDVRKPATVVPIENEEQKALAVPPMPTPEKETAEEATQQLLTNPPKPEPPRIKSNGLAKSLRASKEASKSVTHFNLVGPLAEFLGKLEKKNKHSVVITLDAPPGSGKTRTLFQFLNMAANAGLTSNFASLEEHPESTLFQEKVDMYISPENEVYIQTIDDLPPTYQEFLNAIKDADVIAVDSWNKVFEKYKIDFDTDLRKALDGKIIVCIFQRTTNGTMRGGARAAFDGDIILEVVKAEDFKNSYVQARKNRYQEIPLNQIGYNFFHQQIINPEELNKEEVLPTQITFS